MLKDIDRARIDHKNLSKRITTENLSSDHEDFKKAIKLQKILEEFDAKNLTAKVAQVDILDKEPMQPVFPLKPVINSVQCDDIFNYAKDQARFKKKDQKAQKLGVVNRVFWHWDKLKVDDFEWTRENYAKLMNKRVKFQMFLGLYDKRAEARNIEIIRRFPWEIQKEEKNQNDENTGDASPEQNVDKPVKVET